MFFSVFDIFKIGIGPSSSHTMGPMTAAVRFLDLLRAAPARDTLRAVRVTLRGSLAYTGHGHATDRAVALGLLGIVPAEADPDTMDAMLAALATEKQLRPSGLPVLAFDPETDIVFDRGPPLPGHPNGLIFEALDDAGHCRVEETYYSIGGGSIVTAAEMRTQGDRVSEEVASFPFPFDNARDMLAMAAEHKVSIATMKRANELTVRDAAAIDAGLMRVWQAMDRSIERGLSIRGELPGGLRVKRRAAAIAAKLEGERGANRAQPFAAQEWLLVFAMAVNEENAAGSRIVTAPTNGAAGVIPAVLRYYLDHCMDADRGKIAEFLLTAAAIGGLIKLNASISALEHHLGMTCDPARGLVQVPCIERNGIGATKSVAAASLALRGDGTHFMPLDNCIRAMRETGAEMSHKLKETSLGGLAVNLAEC